MTEEKRLLFRKVAKKNPLVFAAGYGFFTESIALKRTYEKSPWKEITQALVKMQKNLQKIVKYL